LPAEAGPVAGIGIGAPAPVLGLGLRLWCRSGPGPRHRAPRAPSPTKGGLGLGLRLGGSSYSGARGLLGLRSFLARFFFFYSWGRGCKQAGA
jgi:hypothetical protein